MTLSAWLTHQSTIKLAVFIILKIAKLYVSQTPVLELTRHLPIQADLIINSFRLEVSIERQRAVFLGCTQDKHPVCKDGKRCRWWHPLDTSDTGVSSNRL